MAVDTPARIAVLGAGPIGLEAALYARFLGYDVDIYERGNVGENILRWGHVRMFSPFGMNRSSLGLAAIRAQDQSYQPPSDDTILTGLEYADRYLLPLSQSDLIADHLKLGTQVLAVGRPNLLKGEMIGREERAAAGFRILSRDRSGRELVSTATVVLDTTGVYGHPNWAGSGGTPAVGELAHRQRIQYSVPDVAAAERDKFANKNTLLIGGGYSAATTVVALGRLAQEAAETRVTWITRCPASPSGPIPVIPQDGLPERAALAAAANQLATAGASGINFQPSTTLTGLAYDDSQRRFQAELAGAGAGTFEFDNIVANVGYRPDNSLYAELQVHECYASQGPMKLAALLSDASADCLEQSSQGAASLLTPESHFYILGAKSYGRNSNFLLAVGLQQIRELFTLIGNRADLDLYKTALALPK